MLNFPPSVRIWLALVTADVTGRRANGFHKLLEDWNGRTRHGKLPHYLRFQLLRQPKKSVRPADRVLDGRGLIPPKGGHNHGPWQSARRAEGTAVAALDR